MSKAVEKYLDSYAEIESKEISSILKGLWDEVVVIPARQEPDISLTLKSIKEASIEASIHPLVILVVNGSKNSNLKVHNDNEILMRSFSPDFKEETHCLIKYEEFDILLVNRASRTRLFPEKQGVGLARKIGCDIALYLIRENKLRTNWIRTTDADALAPKDYFEPSPSSDYSAMTFPFRHIRRENPQAIDDYETYLHYYVRGLKSAGSPYAFHTIGSTIGISAQAYAQVRGFPKREAGEDFYILNKLAKVGKVMTPHTGAIQLSDRVSERVPFGTGVMMRRVQTYAQAPQLYHPKIFAFLGLWIKCVGNFALHRDFNRLRHDTSLQTGLNTALAELNALEALQNLHERCSKADQFMKQFHIWFDAFKTLKFIHHLRDKAFPEIPQREALASASFYKVLKGNSETGLHVKQN